MQSSVIKSLQFIIPQNTNIYLGANSIIGRSVHVTATSENTRQCWYFYLLKPQQSTMSACRGSPSAPSQVSPWSRGGCRSHCSRLSHHAKKSCSLLPLRRWAEQRIPFFDCVLLWSVYGGRVESPHRRGWKVSRAALYWEQNADPARALKRVNKHSLSRRSDAQDRNDGRWFTGLKTG